MPIFTVDGTGIDVPSLEDALADTRATFQQIFGDDLALEAQTPQGQLAGIIAVLESLIGEALVDLGNATNPDTAVGTQQDNLGNILNIRRIQATRSRVTATLTGVAGTTVQSGARARTTAGSEFETQEDVTLAVSPGVTTEMVAVDTGPVEAAAGTLTEIVTVIPGWETVTNVSDAVLGIAREDDPAYRQAYQSRTGRSARGPLDAVKALLSEALITRENSQENRTSAAVVIQEWTLSRNALLVVAEGGTDGDVTRAVENGRGMGAPTMSAIRGATPDNSALDLVNNGTINWAGVDYTGLDLSSASTSAQKAAALTTLLASAPIAPTIAYIVDRYVCQYEWRPGTQPLFADGTVETNFGLNVTDATSSPGPFVRTREQAVTITMTVARQTGFPGDGLSQLRQNVTAVVNSYPIGGTVWSNDILAAAEGVAGTRVTSIVVQFNSVDVSGIAPALDTVWTLPSANLTITIS